MILSNIIFNNENNLYIMNFMNPYNVVQDFEKRMAHFVNRNFPHHRVDKRSEGIAHPDLNTKELVNNLFSLPK